jgi:hypothetical protein
MSTGPAGTLVGYNRPGDRRMRLAGKSAVLMRGSGLSKIPLVYGQLLKEILPPRNYPSSFIRLHGRVINLLYIYNNLILLLMI